jgi:hypothetical protein
VNRHTPVLCFIFAVVLHAGERPPGDWTGNYAPCERHHDVLKRDRIDLGVRFSTSNPQLAAEFARALDFWAGVLDMTWHKENNEHCAIQIVDGHSSLFQPAQVARAQFPDAPSFQGWIAFNHDASLSATDLFLTAVHELGHMLGLHHSASASSVMYFLHTGPDVFLDSADIASVAKRHKLRRGHALAATTPVAVRPGNSMLAMSR